MKTTLKHINHLQSTASNPSNNVYVDASAGSGKTKILIDRILRILAKDGATSQNILCITYTNAAAQEMHQRLTERLLSWSQISESDLVTELNDLEINTDAMTMTRVKGLYHTMMNRDKAPKLQTLHSFCSQLLQTFGMLPGNTNTSSVMTSREGEELLSETIRKTLKEEYKESPSIRSILLYFDSEYVIKIIFELKKMMIKLRKYPSSDSNLQQEIQLWQKRNKQVILNGVESHSIEKIEKNKLIEDLIISSQLYKKYGNDLPEMLLFAFQHAKKKEYDKALNKLKAFFLTSTGNPRKKLSIPKKLKATSNIQEDIELFNTSFIECATTIEALHHLKLQNDITNIALISYSCYESSKKKSGAFEYDDLIRDAIHLMEESSFSDAIMYHIDSSLDYLLIDEAQDLSSTQWHLIHLITAEFFSGHGARNIDRTIFMVGDYKQSIFSFQGANPSIFLAAKEIYKQKCIASDKIWKEIDMSINFRSSKEILQHVDQRFSAWNLQHIPHADGDGIAKNIESTTNVASMISTWLASKRIITGTQKIIAPSDIMILVRKRGKISENLFKSLSQLNIEVHYPFSNNIQQNPEIQDIITIGKFSLMPHDDLNLLKLLKSPLMQINEDLIFQLCHKRQHSLWKEILQTSILSDERYQLLSNTITATKRYTRAVSFYEWCSKEYQIDNQSAYSEILPAWRKMINNFMLHSNGSMCDFLRWAPNQDLKNDIKNLDAVRIMTMHSAKGLESPITIVFDTKNKYPYSPILESKCGNCILNSSHKIHSVLEARDQHMQSIKSEEERILYVAMTRARNELYVVQ